MSPLRLPRRATYCCWCRWFSRWRHVNGGREKLSVSSQSDTGQADLAREKRELLDDPEAETEELTQIYVKRGVERDVAVRSRDIMSKGALGAHARDELDLSEVASARPVQAALTSAASFSIGAAAPLTLVLLSPSNLPDPNCFRGVAALARFAWLAWCQDGGAAVFKP